MLFLFSPRSVLAAAASNVSGIFEDNMAEVDKLMMMRERFKCTGGDLETNEVCQMDIST